MAYDRPAQRFSLNPIRSRLSQAVPKFAAGLTRFFGVAPFPTLCLPAPRLESSRELFIAGAARVFDFSGELGLVAVFNVARLTLINNSHGREHGDLILEALEMRLQNSSEHHPDLAVMLTRLDSSEIAMAISGFKSKLEVHMFSKFLEALFQSPVDVGIKPCHILVSIGLAIFPEDSSDSRTLLQNAELAVQASKRLGRGVVSFYDARLHDILNDYFEIETDLRQALRKNELYVMLQPLVHSTGEVVGAEVLLRWKHPTRGFVSPQDFLSGAEETGAIRDIDRFVIKLALRHLAEMRSRYNIELPISVNVSWKSLADRSFATDVLSHLQDLDLPPELLDLEITETAMTEEFDRVLSNATTLRQAGVRISLDDFGVGYSSFSRFKDLPITTIKLDRSCTINLDSDAENQLFVRFVVDIAAQRGLTVVAEGVESLEQLEALQQLGCRVFQGYFFSAPLHWPEEFVEFHLSAERRSVC